MQKDGKGAYRNTTGLLLDVIDWVLEALCRFGIMCGAILVIATTVVVGYSVMMRYVFGIPQVWSDELVSFWLVAIVTLGAADVLRRGGHIRIDLVTDRLPARAQPWVEVWGLISVLVLSIVLTISGWEMVSFSWSVGMLSEGYLELPMWIPQSLVPIGFSLMAIASLHRLIQRLRSYMTGDRA